MTNHSTKPTVTIFADASFDSNYKVGGWACWIKGDGFPATTRGAAIKDRVTDSSQAEMIAIANALHVAKGMGALRGHIFIQSDCLHALASILMKCPTAKDRPIRGGHRIHKATQIKSHHEPVLRSILTNLEGITVSLRHVKGHQDGTESRSWVNNHCDEIAGHFMRKRRQKIKSRRRHRQRKQEEKKNDLSDCPSVEVQADASNV